MNPQPKLNTYRSAKYLRFVRKHPCCACGRPVVDAHHIRRLRWGSGTGVKPTDLCTIPLCRNCHSPDTEEKIDVDGIIIDLLMEFIKEETRGK